MKLHCTRACTCIFHFCSKLDLSPYLLGEAAKQISPDNPPIYDLYASVYHYGNSYIGHYFTTVNPPGYEHLGEKYSESISVTVIHVHCS